MVKCDATVGGMHALGAPVSLLIALVPDAQCRPAARTCLGHRVLALQVDDDGVLADLARQRTYLRPKEHLAVSVGDWHG